MPRSLGHSAQSLVTSKAVELTFLGLIKDLGFAAQPHAKSAQFISTRQFQREYDGQTHSTFIKYCGFSRRCNFSGGGTGQRRVFYLGSHHCLGSVFFPGCPKEALINTIVCGIFGVFMALVTAILLTGIAPDTTLGFPAMAAITVTLAVFGGQHTAAGDHSRQRFGLLVHLCLFAANTGYIDPGRVAGRIAQ